MSHHRGIWRPSFRPRRRCWTFWISLTAIPLQVPGSLFCSITIYDAQTRCQVQADRNTPALRSLLELRDPAASGTAELRFGPTAPAPAGDGDAWLQTVPGRRWFAFILMGSIVLAP